LLSPSLERFEYTQTTRFPTCAHDGLRIEMDYTAFQNVADAIALARELDVPRIPPAAFYALSVKRWGKGTGGNNHRILSSEDLRYIIVGREELEEHFVSILTWRT
ncbi:hypothetical protein EDC04DRAFT_2720414, partial [Pisolithus marmoratus]